MPRPFVFIINTNVSPCNMLFVIFIIIAIAYNIGLMQCLVEKQSCFTRTFPPLIFFDLLRKILVGDRLAFLIITKNAHCQVKSTFRFRAKSPCLLAGSGS